LGKIRAANAARKQHITHKAAVNLWRMEHHVSRRMPGGVAHVQRLVADLHRIAVVQPACGLKRLCRRKAKHRALLGQTFNPEAVALVRADDVQLLCLGQLGRAARVVDVGMGQPDGFEVQAQALLCLLAGCAYGAYAVVSQPLILQSGVARVNTWVFFSAAVMSLPIAMALGGVPQTSPQGWAVVVYLGVVATGVAYLLFSMGLRTVSAATSVALSKFEPITAFGLSILIVGERPNWLAFIGLGLVLLGLWLVVRSEMRQSAPTNPQTASAST